MKHIKKFNEALGINKDLEEQVDAYYKEIVENPDKDVFNFFYHHNNVKQGFKLDIKKLSGNNGSVVHGNLELNGNSVIIHLSNRNDKPTLLHEVKHLDYFLRLYPDISKVTDKNSIKKTNIFGIRDVIGVDKYSRVIYYILYIFDPNEFQSRYHGYYVQIDEYIKKHISENPTTDEIYKLVDKCLNSSIDDCFKIYMSNDPIRFDDYESIRNINMVFDSIILNDTKSTNKIYSKIKQFLPNIPIDEVITKFKQYFNIYSKKEKFKIDTVVNRLEKEMNKRKLKYKRKFLRLYQIMCDKYLK